MKLMADRIQRKAVQAVRRRVWQARGLFAETVTVPTKQGLFTVSLRDRGVGKPLFCEREYERDLSRQVLTHLRNIDPKFPQTGCTMLDIGANMGISSIGMLLDGLVHRTIACEPAPGNLALLRRNIQQNNLEDKILCLPIALSDKNGTCEFELSEQNCGDHRMRGQADATSPELHGESGRSIISVESKRLDDVCSEYASEFANVDLVWIDVQGHEGYVFRGGEGFLSQGMPTSTEIWPYGIGRSGMSHEEFRKIVANIWSHYWVLRDDKFVKFPVTGLMNLFDEVGHDGDYTNVILTREN